MRENRQVPKLTRVYSARSIIPATFSEAKVSLLNIDGKEQVLKKGTTLGIVEEAEIVEPNPEAEEEPKMSELQKEAVEKMVSVLPKELSENERDNFSETTSLSFRQANTTLGEHHW